MTSREADDREIDSESGRDKKEDRQVEGQTETNRQTCVQSLMHTHVVSNSGGTAAAGCMNLILLFFPDRLNPN